jgi:putative transposase
MAEISYCRRRFPPVVTQHAVWLQLRFTLGYRDVEDLHIERGLDISYETIPELGAEVRTGDRATATTAPPSAERLMAFGMRLWSGSLASGVYLWRAVDHEGKVLDMLVQCRRNCRARCD